MHPPGESMGSIFRVKNLCQGLTSMSHKCYVFTPFNFSEDWNSLVKFITVPVVGKGNFSKKVYKVIRKILDIRILSNYSVLNPQVFNASINRISNSLLDTIKENGLDLDVIIGETEIGGYILKKIKNELDFPILVDYQNFWPEELVEHKIIKRNSRRYKFLIDIEKDIFDNVDSVITVSKALEQFLGKKFLKNDFSKIKWIKNGGVPLLKSPLKKELPPKIINSGMVVQRSNFKFFFEGLKYVFKKYPETEVYVTRKGERLNEVMHLAEKMKLNINFYWKDTFKEFVDILSNCHVGVVSSTYNLTRKLGFVAKIYDYFSVGIPIVGNDIGGFTSIIKEEQVGKLSSNDPKDLAEKIIEFIEDPKLAYECGMRGIELLKNKYNVKNSAGQLIEYINNINNK